MKKTFIIAPLICVGALSLQAAPLYFGSSSGDWNTAANWFTDSAGTTPSSAAPTSADDAFFNITGVNATTSVTTGSNIAATSLVFNNTGTTDIYSTSSTRYLDIGSGGITLNSGAGNVTIGGHSQTLTARVAASQTWINNSGANLRIYNAASAGTGTDAVTLTTQSTGTGNINFSNALNNGTNGAVLSLVIDSSGTGATTFISSASTYSGGTTVKRGVLQVRVNGSLGSGALTLGGTGNATLQVINSPALSNNIVVASGAGSKSIDVATSGQSPSITGTVTLNDNLNFGTSGTGAVAVTLTKVVSGTGGIQIDSSVVGGTKAVNLTLGDGVNTVTNTYAGNTTITTGSSFTLAQSAALTFYIGANGTSNSVSGAGTATFDGTFAFDVSGADKTDGNSWTIANVTGGQSFAGSFGVAGFTGGSGVWTDGGGFSFDTATGILSYAAIPEPSTVALLAGVGVLLLSLDRRRKNKI